MSEPRQILTPGEMPGEPDATPGTTGAPEAAAPERKKPGPKPKPKAEVLAPTLAGTASSDDLAEFESEDLPQAAPVDGQFSPAQQALIAKMVADAVRASRSSQDPQTAAALAAKSMQPERLPTQDEARMTCEDAVARGIRPRAILTEHGWYTHPEMARTKDIGVAKLGG